MKKTATVILVVVALVGLLSPVMAQNGDLTPARSFDVERGQIDSILILILEIVIAALLVWAIFLWVFRSATSILEPSEDTLGLPKGSISSLLSLVLATVFFITVLASKAYFADRSFMLWLSVVYGGVIAVYLVSRIFNRSGE